MTESAEDLEDITPEESVVPVYLDSTPTDLGDQQPPAEDAAAALREAGKAKLMALGLTEDEAKAVVGL